MDPFLSPRDTGERTKTEWLSHKILVRCCKSKVVLLGPSCKKVASRYISAVSTQSGLVIGHISQRYKKWDRDHAHSFHTTEAWRVTLPEEEWKILRGLHKSLPCFFPENKGGYGRRELKISKYWSYPLNKTLCLKALWHHDTQGLDFIWFY